LNTVAFCAIPERYKFKKYFCLFKNAAVSENALDQDKSLAACHSFQQANLIFLKKILL